MMDLTRMHDHPTVAPRVRWVDDLSELYGRTKAAQVQAEQHGFDGMAAALADFAATLVEEPDVDRTMVWALAECSLADRTTGPASGEPHGGVTRH